MRDCGCDTRPVPAPPLPGRCDHAAAPPSLLRFGCYLIEFAMRGDPSRILDGTLRVEATADGVIASGDLYERPRLEDEVAGPVPDLAAGIPIFPVADYRCYLRVTGVEESAEGVALTLEEHRFHSSAVEFLDDSRRWLGGSTFTVVLVPDGPVLRGELEDSAGTPFWVVTARWVSAYLRRATLEIDRVPLAESPESSGTDASWRTVFDEVGWDLTVIRSHNDVTEPSGESWSGPEAHAMMRALRERGDLDAEWRFHCLAVRRMDKILTSTGWMYDEFIDDTKREGFMVASHWTVPVEPMWGRAQGKRFGTVAPAYFRTAVHELGHAMGLWHRTGNSIMNDTGSIAQLGLSTPETPFPDNIVMSFAAEDRHRLRHWPDLVVRPGTPLYKGLSAPIS